MIITYSGLGFVKLTFGNVVIGINPISKNHKVKASKFGADVAMVSLNDPGFNGVDELKFGNKDPFEVTGPGEYEYSEIFIKGHPSVGPKGKINTIYSFMLEGMRVVHLGVLSSVDLEPDILEEISGADIMFVPAGEEDTLTAKETSKLATSLEPKIIIPVLYGENIKSPLLKDLIEEIGESKDKPTDKLAIKKKDLEGKATDMVILQVS